MKTRHWITHAMAWHNQFRRFYHCILFHISGEKKTLWLYAFIVFSFYTRQHERLLRTTICFKALTLKSDSDISSSHTPVWASRLTLSTICREHNLARWWHCMILLHANIFAHNQQHSHSLEAEVQLFSCKYLPL